MAAAPQAEPSTELLRVRVDNMAGEVVLRMEVPPDAKGSLLRQRVINHLRREEQRYSGFFELVVGTTDLQATMLLRDLALGEQELVVTMIRHQAMMLWSLWASNLGSIDRQIYVRALGLLGVTPHTVGDQTAAGGEMLLAKGLTDSQRTRTTFAFERLGIEHRFSVDRAAEGSGQSFGNPDDPYRCFERLGAGTFGTVQRCVRHSAPFVSFAVKTVNIAGVRGDAARMEALSNEARIMERLRHPGIVQLMETVQENENVFLVMDYMPGGDLFDVLAVVGLTQERYLGDLQVRSVFEQSAKALQYMHSQKYMHRDLKPENILVNNLCEISLDGYIDVKLGDLGTARIADLTDPMRRARGTFAYMAPEVLDTTSYSFPADVWSLGVVLFMMLEYDYPFGRGEGGENEVDRQKISFRRFPTAEPRLHLSQDLVRGLLKRNPMERLSLKDCLDSPWVCPVPGLLALLPCAEGLRPSWRWHKAVEWCDRWGAELLEEVLEELEDFSRALKLTEPEMLILQEAITAVV